MGPLGPDYGVQLQPQERGHGADQHVLSGGRRHGPRFDDNPTTYTWTGGTPTASATNSPAGVYIVGPNKGFQLTVPADTTPRTLKLYVGGWGAQATFDARLSDQSAASYIDTSFNDSGSGDGTNRVYTLTYQAASANQTLTLTWTVTGMNDPQWGNVTLQAATLVTNNNSGTLYQDLQYAYTADGNLTTIADHTVAGGAGDQAMTYDSLDRLTEAEGPYGSGGATASITYSYDELGNLTANSQVGTYAYPTSGSSSVRPHAVTTAGSNTYSYDANGNMTAGAGRSFTYNLENKPLTITIGAQTTTFVYDGDNGRVKKVVGSTTTRYINKLYECENTSCARMIFAGSERVVTLPPGGGVNYYHPDHLGSSNVITDGTGAKVQALTYFPYGGTRTNSSPVTPAVDVPYKYTGKPLDSSTSLYYYGARYYDPVLARFLSADTLVPNPRDPQELNRYTYAGNDPFRYTDPTGHFKLGKFLNRVFDKSDKFFQENSWARALAWAILPPLMMHVDPATRNVVIAGGVGFAVGGPIGGIAGAIVGGAAAGGAGAALTDRNVLHGAGIGALAGAVGYGAGWFGGGLLNPDAGSYLAQIGKGALIGGFKGVSVSLAVSLAEGKVDGNGLLRSAVTGAVIGGAIGAARPIAIGRDVTDLPSRQQNISYWGQEWGKDFSGVTVKEGGLLNAGLQLTGHGGITLGGMINLGTGGGVPPGVMGHELWHVVQAQERGLVLFQAGYVFNSNYYEMEADTMSRTHYGTQGLP